MIDVPSPWEANPCYVYCKCQFVDKNMCPKCAQNLYKWIQIETNRYKRIQSKFKINSCKLLFYNKR